MEDDHNISLPQLGHKINNIFIGKTKMQTLRDLRKQAGKSSAEVAAALGVTRNAVTNYETGIRRVSLEQVLLLAKLYDVSAEEVIRSQLNSQSVR